MSGNAQAPDPGDLPRGIGRPATRELTDAGLTSQALVVRRPRCEVAALHGVGPKALRVLEEAVVAHGLVWAESG